MQRGLFRALDGFLGGESVKEGFEPIHLHAFRGARVFALSPGGVHDRWNERLEGGQWLACSVEWLEDGKGRILVFGVDRYHLDVAHCEGRKGE